MNQEVGTSNLNCFRSYYREKLLRKDIRKLSGGYKYLLFILIPKINVMTRKVISMYYNLK